MSLTRGQARRVLSWERWRALSPKERRKVGAPPCVTCGGEASFIDRGQPYYPCHHEPLVVDAATLERIVTELGAERVSV